uniref:Uncharacterized protein n=1 Tax=Plectus sambesii TaxID=2011161 RepID=A0A914VCN4_9BILA
MTCRQLVIAHDHLVGRVVSQLVDGRRRLVLHTRVPRRSYVVRNSRSFSRLTKQGDESRGLASSSSSSPTPLAPVAYLLETKARLNHALCPAVYRTQLPLAVRPRINSRINARFVDPHTDDQRDASPR